MYKWHVHSAIGRGRPLANDFARVTDGIAASLRQFHLSASWSADDGGSSSAPKVSRAQRSALAAAEISSLAPTGVDARSLAAKPPPRTFTIHRVDHGPKTLPTDTPQRNTFRGGGQAGTRGTFGAGAARGRGGMGMRGRGQGRGRGRGAPRARGARRPRGAKRASAAEMDPRGAPLTALEQAYVDSVERGVAVAAPVGVIDRAALDSEFPALATHSAPGALLATVRDRMRALAGQHGNERLSTEEHAKRYITGTLFVNEADKARAVGDGWIPGAPKKYSELKNEDREEILKTLVGGQGYSVGSTVAKGGLLAVVDGYSTRNETYLPKDGASLRAKLEKLLPAQNKARLAKGDAPQ